MKSLVEQVGSVEEARKWRRWIKEELKRQYELRLETLGYRASECVGECRGNVPNN